MIFKYVLGRKTFEIRYDKQRRIAKNTTVSEHALALLAVCRQVFAETSLLPFNLNTFSALDPLALNVWFRSLRSALAEVITAVRIDLHISICSVCKETIFGKRHVSYTAHGNDRKRFSLVLTSLTCVQLAVTMDTTFGRIDTKDVKREEEHIKGQYELANSGIKFTLTWRTLWGIVCFGGLP